MDMSYPLNVKRTADVCCMIIKANMFADGSISEAADRECFVVRKVVSTALDYDHDKFSRDVLELTYTMLEDMGG